MDKNKILLSSKNIILSEAENGDIFLEGSLGYLDDFNSNGISLVSNGEDFQNSVDSFVGTPFVAKYKYTEDGGDLGSHEAYLNWDGDLELGTDAYGVNEKIWIEEQEVHPLFSKDKKILKVMKYRARIWASRFPSVAGVIRKMTLENKLQTSWELEPKNLTYVTSDLPAIPNPRECNSWRFLANCGLGSLVEGAYGDSAKTISVSSKEDLTFSSEIASAYSEDLKNINKSQLSGLDKVTNNNNPKEGNKMDKLKELEALVSEKDGTIAEMQTKLDELTAKVAETAQEQEKTLAEQKDELSAKLVEASEKLEKLTSEVEELKPFKAQVEKIENEKLVAEREQEIENLKVLATTGGYITEEELEKDEAIAKMISECDINGIKLLKAERVIATVETSSANQENPKKELSEETNIKTDAVSQWLGL